MPAHSRVPSYDHFRTIYVVGERKIPQVGNKKQNPLSERLFSAIVEIRVLFVMLCV